MLEKIASNINPSSFTGLWQDIREVPAMWKLVGFKSAITFLLDALLRFVLGEPILIATALLVYFTGEAEAWWLVLLRQVVSSPESVRIDKDDAFTEGFVSGLVEADDADLVSFVDEDGLPIPPPDMSWGPTDDDA